MVKLNSIHSQLILDSRHKETIQVSVSSGKNQASASVPSGRSTGSHEAYSAPAGEAQKTIQSLKKNLLTREFQSPTDFDQFLLELDKHKLGANVTLALSIAFLRLFALEENLALYKVISELAGTRPSFPRLFANLINGGLHVDPKYHPLPIQEYLLIPKSTSPKEALNQTFSFINTLRKILKKHQEEIDLGDEGGFIISGNDPELGLKLFQIALDEQQEKDVDFGIDAAASSFWLSGRYTWNQKGWSHQDLMEKYLQFIKNYPLLSIEDPFQEEGWDEWKEFYKEAHEKVWIIGDDLTVTNSQRIEQAQKERACNAVIIKPNQIGTIFETIEAVKKAREYGWKVVVSHRSGETIDPFIADLAFGVAADGLKSGSPLQKERLVKYQRLIEIEQEQR